MSGKRSYTRITPCQKVGFRYRKKLSIARSTVWKTLKRFKERGDLSDCPRRGRPRSQRSKLMIKCIRERISRNQRSISLLAKTANMSHRTLRRLVHKDMKILSFTLQKRQILSSFTLQKIQIFYSPKPVEKFTAMLTIQNGLDCERGKKFCRNRCVPPQNSASGNQLRRGPFRVKFLFCFVLTFM